MRIALTGGGTGGHVIPNLSVIEDLRKKKAELLYIGSMDGVEKKMIEKAGVRYEGVACGKFRRYFSWQNFVDVFKVPAGFFQAKRVLKEFSPDVLFSKGGFVSVPVVLAASRLKIPIIAHESDISPGLANKICFRFAKKICLSFEETRSYIPKKFAKKIVVTGMPIREWIADGERERGYKFTGLNDYRPVIVVMGGSLGARQINELVRASLDELLKRFQVVHIAGKGNLDIGVNKKGYVQYEYLDEQLKDVYAICDMAVTRGGANSLAELAFLKKKALVIPLGGEASRGEQVLNARAFVRRFGWSMISGDITREDFINNVEMAFNNEFNDSEKFKNGTGEIVKLILSE
ncbi:MAG: undecaprenyldiphospho-muramoylpentapeptide beta-N-acetylglucosaminyltransferase [Candidatus Peregrinibacteria bacterium]